MAPLCTIIDGNLPDMKRSIWQHAGGNFRIHDQFGAGSGKRFPELTSEKMTDFVAGWAPT